MKKVIFIAMVFLCANATSFAQSKTPSAVISAFNQKFPNATDIKWDKEYSHEYEAEFVWKGLKYSANFSDNGEWLETESQIEFSQLPDKVQKTFSANHKGAIIKAVAKIETSKGLLKYEVEIKKGIRIVEILYKADGSELK